MGFANSYWPKSHMKQQSEKNSSLFKVSEGFEKKTRCNLKTSPKNWWKNL